MLVNILIVILSLLIFIIVMLILYIYKTRKSIEYVLLVLDDIKNENENRKIVIQDGSKTTDICYAINEIVELNRFKINEFEKSEKKYKQLLTSLSHDLRTPLTTLIGYLDAIHNKVVIEEEIINYTEIARQKAYNLKNLIEIMFECFKIDSKEKTYIYENTDINELTRNILAGWISVFVERKIVPLIEISEDELILNVDVSSYSRIINNIIQNSITHSDCDKIGIRITKSNDSAIISIFDNGKGIPKIDLEHIFDRLYKCDKSRSNKGNGLGLSIVKELVNAHNGTISVSSIPRGKTEFCIIIPIKKAL